MNLSTNVKPCKIKTYQKNHIYCQYDENQVDQFTVEMFEPIFWEKRQAITGSAQGRGTTWFMVYDKQHWVLRHYYRGGLIAKIIKDNYFFQTMALTRAAREFNLLLKMYQQGLPAPQPIGYRVIHKGLFYCADLISQRIEKAQDLVAILTQKSLPAKVWQKIGTTIQQFHQQGIYHHDLNAHNILIDDNNKVWLIDFDQGDQRTINMNWQQANLDRLLRSFHKEQIKLTNFNWQASNWQSLLQGYQAV